MHLTYKVCQKLCKIFPRTMCYGVAMFVARICFYLHAGPREVLIDNFKVVLNGKSDKEIIQTAKRAYLNFAKYIIDFLLQHTFDDDKLKEVMEVENIHFLHEAVAQGKGVIIASTHMGNWELGGALIAKNGYKTNAIVLPHADDAVTEFFNKQRAHFGINVIFTSSVLRACINTLKKGEVLGILSDRDVTQAGEEVQFFGKTASMPKGSAYFSRKTGSIILPTIVIRQKNDKYKMIFEDYYTCACTKDKKSDIINCIEKYVKILEKYVRQYPDQWFVFDRIWNTSEDK